MTIAYWILAGLLALAFLFAGGTKIARPKESLGATMAWTEDFSQTQIRLIGVVEVLGAIGLILPRALGIVPVLSPIAAVGLAVVMVGAVVTHLRRKGTFIPPLSLGVFAVAAAVLGFLTLT